MTNASSAESRKSYGEGCLAAHALDLIGDRWALLVARELMLGPKRFGALKTGLPGIATNMLARRLEQMEAAGLVVRRSLPAPASAPGYELTPAGQGLWPVMRELCRWGAAMPGHDPALPISPTALMLSMRAMIDPAGAAGPRFAAAFLMGDECFVAEVRDGMFTPCRADRPEAALSFAGRPGDIAALVYGPDPLARKIGQGRVAFLGDADRGQAFIDLFRLRRDPARDGPDAGAILGGR